LLLILLFSFLEHNHREIYYRFVPIDDKPESDTDSDTDTEGEDGDLCNDGYAELIPSSDDDELDQFLFNDQGDRVPREIQLWLHDNHAGSGTIRTGKSYSFHSLISSVFFHALISSVFFHALISSVSFHSLISSVPFPGTDGTFQTRAHAATRDHDFDILCNVDVDPTDPQHSDRDYYSTNRRLTGDSILDMTVRHAIQHAHDPPADGPRRSARQRNNRKRRRPTTIAQQRARQALDDYQFALERLAELTTLRAANGPADPDLDREIDDITIRLPGYEDLARRLNPSYFDEPEHDEEPPQPPPPVAPVIAAAAAAAAAASPAPSKKKKRRTQPHQEPSREAQLALNAFKQARDEAIQKQKLDKRIARFLNRNK